MLQAHVWTGRALQPAAMAVLEDVATIAVSKVGERNDWYAEASTADAIIVAGETFVTGEVMDLIGPRLRIIARRGIGMAQSRHELARNPYPKSSNVQRFNSDEPDLISDAADHGGRGYL